MVARRLLLINPNSSVATTEMMVAIAQATAGEGFEVIGATATRAPPMILEPEALIASAAEVVEIALANSDGYSGIIVAAFGDPGLAGIRASTTVPAVGIAEAAMLEAAEGSRRFGIAATTPKLAAQINARVESLGLAAHYTGIRITDGDANELVRDPNRLRSALLQTAENCVACDGAQAVIIGGGPLGQAALQLQALLSVPTIAPIPASVRVLIALLSE
jgi:Asp/Glu/hydantoin racemase